MNLFLRISLAYALGFSIASMPGPILALVATETLRRGTWAGIQAAIAPVCVDAAVMLPLALMLLEAIPAGNVALAIAFLGGLFLVWLGIQSLRIEANGQPARARPDFATGLPPFVKGILTHLMNPYAYLFWSTVGLPYVRDGFQTGGITGALHFPAGFWFGASSFNFLVVFLIVRGTRLLPERAESYLHRFAGMLLVAAGILLVVKVLSDKF